MGFNHVKSLAVGRGVNRAQQRNEKKMILYMQSNRRTMVLWAPALHMQQSVLMPTAMCDALTFLCDFCETDAEFVQTTLACFKLLRELHSLGIAHMDAKVNNILIYPLARPPMPGEVTFAHRAARYSAVFCDYETAFCCNTTEFDRSYTALMMGRAWYGGRSAAETRANFENVKGADVYSLTSSIFMVATCDALRKFLSTLISDVVFTLVDPRPGFGGNTFCYYVPDSTKNYGFKTASDAVAQLELFKQTTF